MFLCLFSQEEMNPPVVPGATSNCTTVCKLSLVPDVTAMGLIEHKKTPTVAEVLRLGLGFIL